jgi:uncharacterized membrane protein
MIVMEKRPGLNVHSEYEIEAREVESREAELSVERTDITFHDVAGDKVRIQVTVRNKGSGRSQPTPMRLESAPFGAFVPWQPLAKLTVPALEPGESRELSIDVARPRPTPLGDFNRVPPKKLVTAVNAPDTSPDQSSRPNPTGLAVIFNLLRRGQRRGASTNDLAKTSLAPDLWDMVGRGQPHWAGNINVFIGREPVERHMAQALRIYPGRTNMAMFLVGDRGRWDAYAFELVGVKPDWKATLYDATTNKSLVTNPADIPIEEMQWVETNTGLMVMLATQPPANCKTGNLEVHVTRRSCGKTAVVEFSMDSAAKGPGCYFV